MSITRYGITVCASLTSCVSEVKEGGRRGGEGGLAADGGSCKLCPKTNQLSTLAGGLWFIMDESLTLSEPTTSVRFPVIKVLSEAVIEHEHESVGGLEGRGSESDDTKMKSVIMTQIG